MISGVGSGGAGGASGPPNIISQGPPNNFWCEAQLSDNYFRQIKKKKKKKHQTSEPLKKIAPTIPPIHDQKFCFLLH